MNIDNTLPTESIVFYHAGCMDGLAAAWVMNERLETEAHKVTCIPCQYGDSIDYSLVEGKNVYVVDFSFPEKVFWDILEKAAWVTWIDHHATAIKALSDFHPKRFTKHTNTSYSGAMLAWLYCYPPTTKIPKLLEMIQDRDLWQFKIPETKAVHAYLKTRPMTLETFGETALMVEDPAAMELIVGIGKAVLSVQGTMIASCIKSPRMMPFQVGEVSYQIPVFNCPGGLTSDACDTFLKANEQFTIVASYFDNETHRVFSLRSNEGVNCSAIASAYGGGGHPRACGFAVRRDHTLAKE